MLQPWDSSPGTDIQANISTSFTKGYGKKKADYVANTLQSALCLFCTEGVKAAFNPLSHMHLKTFNFNLCSCLHKLLNMSGFTCTLHTGNNEFLVNYYFFVCLCVCLL